MSDSNIGESQVKEYQKYVQDREGIALNLDAARERLEANYKKEVEETDAKEMSLKCIKAIHEMSPKLNGLEIRERENLAMVRSLSGLKPRVEILQDRVDELQLRLNQQEAVFKQTVQLLIEETRKTQSPTLGTVIKCTLSSLKTSPLSSLGLSSKS